MKKCLKPEDIIAVFREIVTRLKPENLTIKYQPAQTFYHTFIGQMTEKDAKTRKQLGVVYFATLTFLSNNVREFNKFHSEVRAFLHSKGMPAETYEVTVSPCQKPRNRTHFLSF